MAGTHQRPSYRLPSVWKNERYKKYKIGIDDMREALMDLNERRYAETETAPVATGKRNPRVKSSPLAAAQNIGPLVSLLDRAVVLVPRVALAWGIVGIAAAAAIVNVILGLNPHSPDDALC